MSSRPLWQTLWALAYLVLLVAVPTSAALLRVYVRQDCLALGYKLSVEQQRRDALRTQLRKAELTRARGRTPAALEAMASRLNLVPPKPGQTLGAPIDVRAMRTIQKTPVEQVGAGAAPKSKSAAKPQRPKPAAPREPVVPPAAKVAKARAQSH